MKKILVPVDFSASTPITCRYALELATVLNCEIRLFHTYFDQVILADTSFPDTLDMSTVYNEELMKDIARQAHKNMEELQESIAGMCRQYKTGNIPVSTAVTGGEIEAELQEICREYHPDLVVMGTTGKGNTLQVWGKVSTFIMDHAKVPVVTIPAISHYRGFRNVMFAADLSDGNARTLEQIISLFGVFDIVVHVVHFVSGTKQSEIYIKMKALQMKFGKEESREKVRFSVIEVEDENQKAIDQFVHEREIDLIAFQPKRRSLLSMIFTRKITRKNLFETNIPMVAMPG